jgi:transposase
MAADPNQEHSTAESKKLGTIFIDEGTTFDTLRTSYEQLSAQHAALLNERDTLKAELEKLQLAIKQLIRARYGRKSERIDPEQLQLALEGFEQDVGAVAAAQEAAEPPAETKTRTRRPPQRNRGHLPAHLERYEVVLDVADKTCPCCGGALHVIDEDVAEQLDVIPLRFRVRVTRRPRYGCRACAEAVIQAPAPERPIPGGMATEALIAQVAVSKYGDGLPLYRQAQIHARDGIDLDRSTLADWCGRAAWWLTPLWELLLSTVLSSPKIFCDDTHLPVLAPGTGKTRTGSLWGFARDDRPWAGELPPAVAYVYSEDRTYDRPKPQLAGFAGVLQVDGWGGFKRLTGGKDAGVLTLAFCWSHARRGFHEIYQATQSPIAGAVIGRIAALYRIEDTIRGRPPDERLAVRQRDSRPKVEALKIYLETQLGRISGKSTLATAIRYALNHWDGLCVFLSDGRVEIDTNTVERLHRTIAISRRNALFAGSDAGARSWAIFTSLIQSAKLNGVDPFAYLKDVLEQIVSGRVKNHELARLLPWNWKAAQAVAPAAAA